MTAASARHFRDYKLLAAVVITLESDAAAINWISIIIRAAGAIHGFLILRS